MTIVALADGRLEIYARQICSAASLRAWLADRWAVLFSHPDDFAQEQLEMDRWVSVLSRSFRGCSVAPVALTCSGRYPEQGWFGRLAALEHESAAILALDPLPGTTADLSTGALRAAIARRGPRFALILDSSLRCRRTLTYRLPAEPSPLDLIGWAVALRKRDRVEESPRGTSAWSFPARPICHPRATDFSTASRAGWSFGRCGGGRKWMEA